MYLKQMKQYESLGKRIIEEGAWVENDRTGVRCKTVINENFTYDCDPALSKLPLVTTRKASWKSAIAELLGYLRGYDDAQKFADIGSPTWFANANENTAWLNNPNRKGHNDMGLVYGAIGRNFPKLNGGSVDLLRKIVDNLRAGRDDRGEILTFYHPGAFEHGCLRPCMHTHQFSLLDGKLYLNSYQRSVDAPLGLSFNMVQVYVLLRLIAQITGHTAGKAYHNMVNCHVYENQYDLFVEQMSREPFESPTLHINPGIKSLEDIETWVTTDDFIVTGYESHPPIKYPFSV